MRSILAALDMTPRSTLVFDTALDLAKQYKARLLVFRAVGVPPVFPPAAATHHMDALGPKLVADAKTALEELASRARSQGVETTVEVVVASEPWRAIIDGATAHAADAIVIGSHGYHLIDRVLGTTAARVANRATVLVIVVHEPAQESSPSSTGPYRSGA